MKRTSNQVCSNKTYLLNGLIIAGLLLVGAAERAHATLYTVNGTSGPWQYANGGLNTGFQYGVNDQTSPTVISGLGLGQSITLTYDTGTVSTSAVLPFTDANGVLTDPNPDGTPHGNGVFPSYFSSQPSLTYAGELVGTFANSLGQIVGTPFAVGDGPITFVVPSGATQLQLGVNDNKFSDNRLSWTIDAEIVPVPEPSSLGILGLGGILFASCRRLALGTKRG